MDTFGTHCYRRLRSLHLVHWTLSFVRRLFLIVIVSYIGGSTVTLHDSTQTWIITELYKTFIKLSHWKWDNYKNPLSKKKSQPSITHMDISLGLDRNGGLPFYCMSIGKLICQCGNHNNIHHSWLGPGRLCFYLHLLCYAQVLSGLPIVLLFCHLLCS